MTIATAMRRRRRKNPSGGSLREPWVSEDGRGEMEKKVMEKKGKDVLVVQEEWRSGISRPALYGPFLYSFFLTCSPR